VSSWRQELREDFAKRRIVGITAVMRKLVVIATTKLEKSNQPQLS
jgi:hypothetical protein